MDQQRVVALTFDDVQDVAQEFERLLSHLKRRGYVSVTSREFRAWQQGTGRLPERSVLLTFDAGLAGHFEMVVPLLLRYRLIGTFFVTANRIGVPGHMTREQLQQLAFLGMEVGSYGLSRRPLTTLSAEELERELTESRRRLEQWLGCPVTALAAPGGFWNATVANAAHRAGYETVWASLIGANGRETNRLGLRRMAVCRPFSSDRLIALIEGHPAVVRWAVRQSVLIRALKRGLGAYWYEQLKHRLAPHA